MKKRGTGLLMVLVITSCAGVSVQPLMPTPVLFSELEFSPLDHIPEAERWTPRRVYYATTRQRKKDLQRIDYSNKESDRISLGLSLIGFGDAQLTWSDLQQYSSASERDGVIDLSIAGLLEIGSFTPSEGASPMQDHAGALAWLISDINSSIADARDKDLLIYVHGAKVNFYNANAFAAQLDHFMGRDMTSIAFSWPSRQNIFAYGTGGDVRRAYRAAPALTSLIEELSRTSARRIHIVCWSAGGRVVTDALAELHRRHAKPGGDLRGQFRLGTVYYAAGDVPRAEFIELLPSLNAVANRIVITVSSQDGALNMAKTLMGGGLRIGQRSEKTLDDEQLKTVMAADRLEIVDVSRDWEGRGFDITGHRYWFDHPWASTDVVLAIRSDLTPQQRGLAPADFEMLWSIPPDYPSRLRETMSQPGLQLRDFTFEQSQ